MTRITRLVLAGSALLWSVAPASAQYSWGRGPTPRAGACFYEDINFGGRYFCVPLGDAQGRVPRGTNDEISSVRLFGYTEVTVFRSNDMRGESRRFTSSMRDLRDAGFNDKISSFVVDRRGASGGYGGGTWGGAYGAGNYGGGNYRPPTGNDGGRYNGGYGGAYNGGSGSSRGGWGGAYGGGSYGSSHSSGGRYTYEQAEAMVRTAYQRVLHRAPDPAARPWVNEVVKNNWSQRQLEDALRDTPEGRNQPL